jgi:hypothetical protein
MGESEMVEAAELDISPAAAAALTAAGDGWFSREQVVKAARFTGSGAWSWRLGSGLVEARNDPFGYTFARGTETVAEYRELAATAGVAARHPADWPDLTGGAKPRTVRANPDLDLGRGALVTPPRPYRRRG